MESLLYGDGRHSVAPCRFGWRFERDNTEMRRRSPEMLNHHCRNVFSSSFAVRVLRSR